MLKNNFLQINPSMSKQKNSNRDGGSLHPSENCRNAATFAGERMPVWILALRIIRNVSATKNSGNATYLIKCRYGSISGNFAPSNPRKVSVNSLKNHPRLIVFQHKIPQPMILSGTNFSQFLIIAE